MSLVLVFGFNLSVSLKQRENKKQKVPVVLLLLRDQNHCEHFVKTMVELFLKHDVELDAKH